MQGMIAVVALVASIVVGAAVGAAGGRVSGRLIAYGRGVVAFTVVGYYMKRPETEDGNED